MLYFIPSLLCKDFAPTAAAVVLSTFILILHLLFYHLNMSKEKSCNNGCNV